MKIIVEYSNKKQVPIKVVSAKYKNNYIVELVFSDSSKKSVKFGSFLRKSMHPIIRSYLKEDKFKKFYIDNGNIVWGKNRDLVFPIEQLHRGKILFV
ncbi:MAG: DUF2442 domain-containing protein [Fibromonadaceae bacterium]|jgi:hypothetical protein|nr:DUF2442 domain-containing protein [Fibromonadaceae bacterium]